eukprot:6474955-Alexandrium_andersonii.AAC.1
MRIWKCGASGTKHGGAPATLDSKPEKGALSRSARSARKLAPVVPLPRWEAPPSRDRGQRNSWSVLHVTCS